MSARIVIVSQHTFSFSKLVLQLDSRRSEATAVRGPAEQR